MGDIMELNELSIAIDRIQKMKIDEFRVENEIEFVSKILEHYDSKDRDKVPGIIVLNEFVYLTIFFHKYCCNLYKNKVGVKFISTNNKNYYDYIKNEIVYSYNGINLSSFSITHLISIFKEHRKAYQEKTFKYDPDINILNIDPLSLVMLKEKYVTRCSSDLYINNYKQFVSENDANICCEYYLKKFFTRYWKDSYKYTSKIRNNLTGEFINYASIILNDSVVFFDYEKKMYETLPVFFECNKVFLNNLSHQDVKYFPILKLICHNDGSLKDYDELMHDRAIYLEMVGDGEFSRYDAFSNYTEGVVRSYKEHINAIYYTIIQTDPLLCIENAISKNKFDKLYTILSNCPMLLDLYETQLISIFCKYVVRNKYIEIRNLLMMLNNTSSIVNVIDNKYRLFIKKNR